jgi:hypothetical protein
VNYFSKLYYHKKCHVPKLNGVSHFHLSSSHLAVGHQVKDLKSIILEKSLFVKGGGAKFTQLVPIICISNSNELTDIQSPLKNVPSTPLPKNYRRLVVLREAITENNAPCPEDEGRVFLSNVNIFL